jgi:zinc protease
MKFIYSLIIALFIGLHIGSAQKLDRSKLPASGPAPAVKLGTPETFTLANGLKVFVVRNTKLPKVSFNMVLDIDPLLEGDKAGLASISGGLLETGTKTRTKEQIDEEIDQMGAVFGTNSRGLYASSLSKHTPKLFEIMADVLLNPNFSQAELDKAKKRRISSLASQKDNPNAISSRVTNMLLYGNKHPYGEQETKESIQNIRLEDINNYYNTYFKANIGYFAIVGDITLTQAKTLVEKHFSTWATGTVPKTVIPEVIPPAKTKVVLVDRPASVQSVVYIVNPADLKPGTPNNVPTQVMNDILGSSEARLFNNLREKHGFTYGAYSNISTDKYITKFGAGASVRNAVTDSSIVEILKEMNNISATLPSQEELDKSKTAQAGNFVFMLENPQTIANFAINQARYNVPADYYQNYLKSIEGVTAQDIQAMAQKYVMPNNAYIVVVGKASEIADKLKKFGEIEYRDAMGLVLEAPAPPAPKPIAKPAEATINPQTILDTYIEKIGGKAKIEAINDYSLQYAGEMNFNGNAMTSITSLSKARPNKSAQEMRIMGQVGMRMVTNGQKALSEQRGNKREMSAEEQAVMAARASMFYELNPTTAGMVTKYIGLEKIDGKECHNIEFTIGKKSWNEFYQKDSGLKVQTSETAKSPQGEMTISTIFKDYKVIDGILWPHTLVNNFGRGEIENSLEKVKVNKGVDEKVFKID